MLILFGFLILFLWPLQLLQFAIRLIQLRASYSLTLSFSRSITYTQISSVLPKGLHYELFLLFPELPFQFRFVTVFVSILAP